MANLPMGNIEQMCSKFSTYKKGQMSNVGVFGQCATCPFRGQHWQNPAETELRFQGKFSKLEPKPLPNWGKKRPNRASFNSSIAIKSGKTSNIGFFGPKCAICACRGKPGRKRRRFQGKFFVLDSTRTKNYFKAREQLSKAIRTNFTHVQGELQWTLLVSDCTVTHSK